MRPSAPKASAASLSSPLLRLLPGGMNQFPGGTSTRCGPAPSHGAPLRGDATPRQDVSIEKRLDGISIERLTQTVGGHWNDPSPVQAIGPICGTGIVAALVFLVTWPARLGAQNTGGSMAQPAQQAAMALTGDQQSAANSAGCSAIGSQVPNPAAASPSLLSSPR